MSLSGEYSDQEEGEEEEEEDIDLTDYEDYNYSGMYEEEEEEEDSYSMTESEHSEYPAEDCYERDYSEEEPEIVCTTSVTSNYNTRQPGGLRRISDLMVVIVALCAAVIFGIYSFL